MFGRDDFEGLAARLASIRGRFILSINDAPEVRAIFAAFDQHVVDLTYTIASGPAKAVQELVISSPGLPTTEAAPSLFG